MLILYIADQNHDATSRDLLYSQCRKTELIVPPKNEVVKHPPPSFEPNRVSGSQCPYKNNTTCQ
jgi:hypothetical protein